MKGLVDDLVFTSPMEAKLGHQRFTAPVSLRFRSLGNPMIVPYDTVALTSSNCETSRCR